MKLKVLPLEFWMQINCITTVNDVDYCAKRLPAPIFNREGYYHDRENNYTWFESLVDGKILAWEYDSGDFLYSLGTKTAWWWHTPEKYQALEAVVNAKIATKQQIELYWQIYHAYEFRSCYRSARINAEKVKARVKKRLEESHNRERD